MTALDLTGALVGLKPMETADLPRFKAAVEAGQQDGWCYYLPHLLSRNRAGRRAVLIAEDGAICLYFWRRGDAGPRLDLYLPPVPLNVGALDRALERANDFNGDRSAQILRVDERDAALLADHPRLRLSPRRAQYLYRPASYADLGGGKYRTLRRHAALVEAMPGVEVLPYTAAHAADCQALLARWQDHHRAMHGDGGGSGATSRVIDLAGQLPDEDLMGDVVLVDGRLAAFAFGGAIRPGLACFCEAKAEGVPGMSYFHRLSFLRRLRAFDLVNDGSDLGRTGLRQLKDSLRPVRMHAEHRAAQRRR